MPGEVKLVEEFAATLRPAIMGNLFKEIVSEMRLAGEMGPLLPIERKLAISIERARVAFTEQQKHGEGFLPGLAPIKRQSELDLSGIDNLAFFEKAEEQIIRIAEEVRQRRRKWSRHKAETFRRRCGTGDSVR